jgi:hypothetical protein
MNRIFLLSPARCDGRRARILMNPHATFALAEQLRSRQGAALGDVFGFLSGLYFRGKLAYATMFGRRARSAAHTFIITTDRGLIPPETRVHTSDLVAFSGVDIAANDRRYRDPLRRDAAELASAVGAKSSVILLGSIATGKYVDAFAEIFGERLLFPREFVGRGDMSRGGLLLRCVREARELEYIPVIGATRHGNRPAKLERIR